MRAMVMRSFGGPDVLQLEDVATPRAELGEVLVRVGAVEVSRTRDAGTRSGRHPFSQQVHLPHILGGDFAGVVESAGPGVDATLVGKRVGVTSGIFCGKCDACLSGSQHECLTQEMIGIHRWGSYAEFVRVPIGNLHELPANVGMIEAAAMAATGSIALMQLREARLNAGDKVIVTGVTGALASVLAMLAPAFGVQAIGLSRRVAQTAVSLNATVLDSSRVDLAQAIVDACGGERPNAAIDNVSSPEMFDQYFPVLRNGARIIVSGAIGTPDLPVLRVPAQPMYTRSISLIGIRTADYSAIREFWGLVRDGFRLPHDILHEQPLETAAAAHRRLADGTATGHTILRVSPTEL